MNNQDYIRAGVELADGWENGPENGPGSNVVQCGFGNDQSLDSIKQPYLDALTAQLVRQCDSKGILVYCKVLTLMIGDEKYGGADRTMSTIKAIIDSKVLEETL